jgi:hypothetical protein
VFHSHHTITTGGFLRVDRSSNGVNKTPVFYVCLTRKSRIHIPKPPLQKKKKKKKKLPNALLQRRQPPRTYGTRLATSNLRSATGFERKKNSQLQLRPGSLVTDQRLHLHKRSGPMKFPSHRLAINKPFNKLPLLVSRQKTRQNLTREPSRRSLRASCINRNGMTVEQRLRIRDRLVCEGSPNGGAKWAGSQERRNNRGSVQDGAVEVFGGLCGLSARFIGRRGGGHQPCHPLS